jgi:hypothetical protein
MNRTLIHLFMLAIAAMHPDDCRLVTVGFGVGTRAAERLGPVSGQSLDMLRVEAVAEGMVDHVVGHYPGVPRPRKTA